MITNTLTRYGAAARFFHWAIALLVLADIALGLVGKFTPRTADTVVFLQTIYSAHKTIGVTVLFLAILRVGWALTQSRPVPLHPNRKLETFAAETAHWVLYAAIFVLPVSGWVLHSAEVGFAPIWWPFGQDLPFVPKSETIAVTAANVHWAAGILLAVTVAAHIAGALKHAILDRDDTLARMVRGASAGDETTPHGRKIPTFMFALVVWVAAVGGAVTVFAPSHDQGETTAPVPANSASGWQVTGGNVTITITQLGAQVSGTFGTWQANIDYDQTTGRGDVRAVIETTTLVLGSVTDQAKGAEFFDVENFSQAEFDAVITRLEGAAHVATGTLTLVGQSVPMVLMFDLEIVDGVANMTGTATLDRRDFNMGASYGDETSVGFGVDVVVSLTAQSGS